MTKDLVEYLKGIVLEDSKLKEGDIECDKDRCWYTWENFYSKVYGNEDYWKKTDFLKLKKVTKGYGVKDKEITISGDTLFNFKEGNKKNQKYEFFANKLGNDQYYIGILEICKYLNYSFFNFGFLPEKGDLQGVKNNYNDRLDSLIWLLNDYYIFPNKTNNPIFSHITKQKPRGPKIKGESDEKRRARAEKYHLQTMNQLTDYLDSFVIDGNRQEAIYNLCKALFLIDDKQLIGAMIKSGKKIIDCKDDVVLYMKMAIKFWIWRDENYYQGRLKEILVKDEIIKDDFLNN